MLLAANSRPPRRVGARLRAMSGTKMSKTAGTAVTLGEAIDRHGTIALRYFLLREVGFDNDGDFTWERFAPLHFGARDRSQPRVARPHDDR